MKKMKFKIRLFKGLTLVIFVLILSILSINFVRAEDKEPISNTRIQTENYDQSSWKWTLPTVISTESTESSVNPAIATDSAGNIHVVWYDGTNYGGSGTDYDIFYKSWDSSTASWTTTEIVSTESSSTSLLPTIVADNQGNIHVAWEDGTNYDGSGVADMDIFYKRREASSSSWTTTEVVSTESTEHSRRASLAVDQSNIVYISWQDDTDYNGAGTDTDIFYKKGNWISSSWFTTEVVSTESNAASEEPSIALDLASKGDVHIVWEDATDYNGCGTDKDTFYKCWDHSADLWNITEVVSTESTSESYKPDLTITSDSTIHIAWQDATAYGGSGADWDVFYKNKESLTSAWTTTKIISITSSSTSENPSIAKDSADNVHLAWDDYTDYEGAGIDYDVFYRRFVATDSHWTSIDVVTTEATDHSLYPCLAVDTLGNVHVAWRDDTIYAGCGADYDIFYKLLTGPPPAPELAFIVPNPTNQTTVSLDWNNILESNSYFVYRSTSYIWHVKGLVPIANVFTSEYIDTVPAENYYYYVIVAENFAGNSSHSNCQYTEVITPNLATPELSPILPNPTELSSVSLLWSDIEGAIEYYVYRSVSFIWSLEGLTPVATVDTNTYIDTLPSEGYYFYVIVANDGLINSLPSNCEFVEYKIPTLREFIMLSSMIIGIPLFLLVVSYIRKKSKMS